MELVGYVVKDGKAVKAGVTDEIVKGSCVTVAPGYKEVTDAANGPLAPGKSGIVIEVDKGDNTFKVEFIGEQTLW